MSRFALATAGLVLLLVAGAFLVVEALGDDQESVVGVDTTTTEGTIPPAPDATTSLPSLTSTTATPVTPSIDSTTTSATTATTASVTSSTTASPAATTTTIAAPPFSSSITTPTEADLHASWEPGCPVGPPELRILTVSHWNYAGSVSNGEIVVAAGLAGEVIDIFRDLYEAGFPIERMELVDEYGGDDDASMAANNTSAFNCRLVTGGTTYSEHSYGRAIDINPLVNPYVKGSTILPPAGAPYVDRSLDAPGMIHAGDEVVQAFAARGWIWGGTWTSLKDYQHFSTTGK